jgi:transmembrane sensor
VTDPQDYSSDFQRAQDEAAQWVVKKSLGLDPEERKAYEKWLEADPMHRERIAANQNVWDDADLLKDMMNDVDDLPDFEKRHSHSPADARVKRHWNMPLFALAAAACIAFGFFFLELQQNVAPSDTVSFQGSYAAAKLERHFLPDGSLIELRAGAEAVVRFDSLSRQVRLLKGEAHFSVSKVQKRPFMVDAGNTRFQAIGTAFSVNLNEREVSLLVTEGKVGVGLVESPSVLFSSSEAGDRFATYLTASQQVVLPLENSDPAPKVEAKSGTEIDKILSWKRKIFDFEATPLAQVIEDFNRHNRDQLALRDPSLGKVEIDGRFRSDNLPAFVRLIEITAGIKSDRSQSRKIFLYRK